ncbi:recombinase family protein [Mycolicibacterium neoaurum]|uniref:recombinase family protein n=1 Tax=Mycolicibacterium neoaurum TaxID=1795 RepID=UPI002671F48F|nr:recombinase family protein [Mycolicibacterium neoaurum]MDO3403427.1 recombinase family protein [Mycolicibacterium neoaurum]
MVVALRNRLHHTLALRTHPSVEHQAVLIMNAPDTQVRAGCYCRISSDPNDKREGVDRQRTDTTALCEVKGWTPAAFYIDDRSASNGKQRPEWDRLLRDIEAWTIDAIAAWDQDRGWRMMHELEGLRRFFTSLRRPVALATTGQGDIDLYSPTGVMMAQIKTAVSEHEVSMMKVRMRRAAKQKAENGRPQWKKAFGYLPDTRRKEDDDGTRQIDPETAPLVAEAYRALLAGSSLKSIAALFNDAGAHGLTGRPWTESTVSLFLRKPRNAGLHSHNGEIVGKGTWTLASSDVYTVQNALPPRFQPNASWTANLAI